MANLKTIAVLTCWYGPYPWYMPYFIHSCAYNPQIDFFIITDNKERIPDKPQNVKVLYKTLEDIAASASEKLEFKVNISYPYKLCDFKPAYGFIFSEVIQEYDVWGYSDMDVIYGLIRHFIDSEMLETYDFISVRHDYTTGCFALYRNNEKMNMLFMRSKDYRRVFSEAKHYCFDECNFMWDELEAGKSIFELETEIESFTQVVKAAEMANVITAHFDFILVEGKMGRVVFHNGRIIYKNQFEAILYHLVRLKRVYSPAKMSKKIPDTYFISPTRIYHKRRGRITFSEMDEKSYS